jgi:Na+/H+ antiporter NhaD/arsenite permease-like protein
MIEIVPLILLATVFILMLVLIAKNVIDRTALSIILAVVSFAIILIFTDAPNTIILNFVIGTSEDGYSNFRTIMLLLGFSILSFLAQKSGLFQFIAFKLIQMTKGDAKKIMVYNSLLTFFIVSMLSDYVTAFIMLPLTITICRTLRLNPIPFIIIQAMYFKIGATVLPISSISSIIISNSIGITFLEFLLFSGLLSLFIAFSTIIIVIVVYQKRKGGIQDPLPQGITMFLEYDPWTFVRDRKFMVKIFAVFIGVILSVIFLTSETITPDMISITGAAVALLINRDKIESLMKEIDLSLLLYLVGLFVVTGGMQYVGLIDVIGSAIQAINIPHPALILIVFLWIGAILSAFVDNIPITQLLIPILAMFLRENPVLLKRSAMGLGIGIIWGDNLTPFGDTILVLNIAKNYGVDVDPKEIFKVNAPITVAQLSALSLIFVMLFEPMYSLFALGGIILIVIAIFGTRKAIHNKQEQKNGKIENNEDSEK